MKTEKLQDEIYDKYMMRKDINLLKSSDLSLKSRKLRHALSIPVNNPKVQIVFQRAFYKYRCVYSWMRMVDEIRLYGTGSSLFDATFAYKEIILTVMDKKKFDDESKANDSTVPDWKLLLVHPSSRFVMIWNLVAFVLAVYTVVSIPFCLAFYQDTDPFFIVNVLVDLFFFFDIILKMNTMILDKYQNPIKNRSLIFMNYLKGSLLLDLAAMIPFCGIFEQVNGKDYEAIRILRLFRISKVMIFDTLIQKIPVESFQKLCNTSAGINRLFIGLFLILILIHFVSCFWNYAAVIEGFSPDTWVVRNGLKDEPLAKKYLYGVYFAFTVLMTVGFGDIYGVTKTEMAICIVWEFIGIAFYSFIFGTISSVLTALDQKNEALSKKLEMAELLAKDTHLPTELVEKMIREIKVSSNTLSLEYDEKIKLVANLPRHLRDSICKAMYNQAATKIFFFQNKEMTFTSDIFPKLVYQTLSDKETLYSKNDFADEMYFLISGRISFVFGKKNLVFKSMIPGSYFGEIEMIEQIPREYGAMSVGECSLLVMPKSVFQYMMRQYPKISTEVKEVALIKKLKIDSSLQDIIELLDEIDIRKEKTLSELAGLSKPYKSREFERRKESNISKNPNSLYGIEYQNRYLKFSISHIHEKIDRLEQNLIKFVNDSKAK